MFSIHEILGLAVKLEKNGEIYYRTASARFSEPSLVSLLRWLADEELRHMDWFMSKRSALKPAAEERELEEIGDELLREIMGSQTFSLQEVDLSKVHDSETMLGIAIEFESDTILFYEMLRTLVEDKGTADELSEIIKEENSHIESLRAFRPEKGSSTGKQIGRTPSHSSGGLS